MKLRNKKTGEIVEREEFILIKHIEGDGGWQDASYHSLAELNEDWEDYQPAEPLIKDEKIRKAVRAWAEVLDLNEVEFYGANTWIGFREINSRTGWSSKFELDYFGSNNEFIPYKRYTIDELCGEEEECEN